MPDEDPNDHDRLQQLDEIERDVAATAKADLFPAYDDDGGLLLVLTPGS